MSTLLAGDIAGKHVYVWPDVANIEKVISHYRRCKGDSQQGSLCIVVPSRHDSEWIDSLDGFQLLAEYSAGTKVLEERYSNAAVTRRLPRGVQVFYEGAHVSPDPSEDCSDRTLKMRCVGQVAAQRANFLLDSGATGSYVSKEFVSMLGIKPSGEKRPGGLA